jgi:hypothetical protein
MARTGPSRIIPVVGVVLLGASMVTLAEEPQSAAPQFSAAADANMQTTRPTGPPPGSPAPGSRCLGCGIAPEPIAPNDYAGWTSLFDGRTLDGWDGSPEVWRVDDGAIVAETWPERRVGTTFLIWRGDEPGDFELKLDVKADYDVHGGVFYRGSVGPAISRGGGPASTRGRAGRGDGSSGGATPAATPARGGRGAQPAFVVPADPRWNVRGYAIDWDWDPGNNGNVQDAGTGRAESQIGWRGHIVRMAAGQRPTSIGSLGDRHELMQLMPLGEWNQLHIVAHGRQLTHIVNGHVMAIVLEDDPAFLKTSGVIALQIEQFGQGRISFRNIYLKQ